MLITPIPETKSLRQQVYDFLRQEMESGKIKPGLYLNLNEMSKSLGISKTPLRDALLHLETEGFVTFFPRKGIMLNELTLETIQNIYEILGALESQAIYSVGPRITSKEVALMDELNQEMREALDKDKFELFYEKNLSFHHVYLNLSTNQELLRTLRIMKQRLYDFPRRNGFVKEWEIRSTGEHQDIVNRLKEGNFWAAGDYMRDVHWSFRIQEKFIQRYYFLQQEQEEKKRRSL